MADKGFDVLSVEPVVAKDAPYAIEEADLPRVFEEYDRLTEAYLERHREGNGFFFFHFNMDLSGGPCVAKRLSGCGAGHEYYAVAANGDLYPCHQFVGRAGYRLGSVFEGVTNKEFPKYFRESHVLNNRNAKSAGQDSFAAAAVTRTLNFSTATSASLTRSAAQSRRKDWSVRSGCRRN